MKHPPPLTLVTSGPTRHNIFARFPGLGDSLGPIRATSQRTASRAAKLFRGGWAAESWREVLDGKLIVIQSAGPKLFAEMHALGSAWRGRTILACDGEPERRPLAALESQGAGVVYLDSLDPREPLVALSGDSTGISRARRLLTPSGIRCLTIRDGAGPALLAAIASLEEEIATALRHRDHTFIHAGLRRTEARLLGVGAALRALRR